jgi:PAS domain S-box-containing protein
MVNGKTAHRHVTAAVLGYGLAVLSVAVAMIITLLLRPDGLVTPVFFLAIILSAWVGGIGPGMVAALLATLAIDYFFLEPQYSLKFDPTHLPQLIVFFVSAALVSSWSVARKRAETLLRQARDEQEAKVQERTTDLKQTNETLQAEVAERGRVEETLREQAALLDLTHDTVFVRDLNDVITYWNRGAEERYGWKQEEAMGQVSHQLTQTVFPAPLEEINVELLGSGRWEGELIHTKRDGAQVVVASRWSLQRDAQGNPIAILETSNDITERKRAEEALRDSEEQWRAVFENNPTMYFVVDAAGSVLSVNPYGAEQLGYTVDELVGHSVLNLFYEADRDAVLGNAAACLEQLGRTMSWELRKVRKDGTMLWVRETARAMLLKSRPVVLVVCEDITERKRAEEALRESEGRYRSIFQGAGVSLWEEDFSQVKTAIDNLKARGIRDFRQYLVAHSEFVRQAIPMVKIVDVNDTTVKLLAAESKEEVLGSLDGIFLPETEEVFAGELVALSEGRTSFESETVLRTLKGDRLTVLFTITFPPEPSKLDSVLVSIMDITERKRAEEALDKAQAELAHLTRLMTMGELAASIAHEVNQPLTAVITNANACTRWLAGQSPNLDEAREAISRIVRDGNRASEVIKRIRALLKKTTPQKSHLDINETIKEIIALAQSEARRNKVLLAADLAAGLPPVLADRVQLQQVVLNLIINGIEAMRLVTDRPRNLLVRTQRDESGPVVVSVEDSGTGIDPQNIDRLFDAFYTTKAEGMGMGLSISRSIIEAHGGKLWASANCGRGAAFQFTLPANSSNHHN